MEKDYAVRPIIVILLALVLGAGAGFLACYFWMQPEDIDLRLQVTAEKGLGFRNISSEELGGNYDGITYVDVAEAAITLDGETMLLEHAIRDGLVTVEQLIAQAQEDARNKECVLKYNSYMGITDFIYSYRNQYDLIVRYDVFECSDGAEYLITDFMVTPHTKSRDVSIGFTRIDKDGNIVNLLYEDWGLDFTVTEVSHTGIFMNYTQQDGMSVGELSVKWFHITDASEQILEPKNGSDDVEPLYTPDIPITKNTAAGELSINWQDTYGDLPPGDYTLHLYIYDTYDEAEIHPLIRKYCHGQYFEIPFTVS